VTSIANSRPESTLSPACSGQAPQQPQAESRVLLALSVLDWRAAVRDRYEGAEREAFLEQAITEARMALDGASIDEILESRAA
jgi:hypothetical protein